MYILRNITEWLVNHGEGERSSEEAIQTVLQHLKDNDKGRLAELLSKSDTVVLSPRNPDSWLKGVVLFGFSGVNLGQISSGYRSTGINFRADSDREGTRHELTVEHLPPKIRIQNGKLVMPSEVGAGIRTRLESSTSGSDETYCSLSRTIQEKKEDGYFFRVKNAILVGFSRSTTDMISQEGLTRNFPGFFALVYEVEKV